MIIKSYEAAGILNFGMKEEEIINLIGIPKLENENFMKNKELFYEGFNIILENDIFVEIGILPTINVIISGVRPFVERDGFAKLCAIDGQPFEVLGSIVLMRLGISLGGFHDNDEAQKAITAFAAGRWDPLKSKMKPFSIGS